MLELSIMLLQRLGLAGSVQYGSHFVDRRSFLAFAVALTGIAAAKIGLTIPEELPDEITMYAFFKGKKVGESRVIKRDNQIEACFSCVNVDEVEFFGTRHQIGPITLGKSDTLQILWGQT
jgi:hypothetical protein